MRVTLLAWGLLVLAHPVPALVQAPMPNASTTAKEALGKARQAALIGGNPAEALEWYWKAAQLGRAKGEEIPAAWYNAGFLAAGLRDGRAAAALSRFLQLDSTSAFADRARSYLVAVNSPRPPTPADSAYLLLVNLARRAMAEQDLVGARSLLTAAAQREPHRWEAWAVGAQFLRTLGHLAEASQWLDHAVVLAPREIADRLRLSADKGKP